MPKHPQHPSPQSYNPTSEPHPGCDPSNGKWCIMEERVSELMKRVAGWHFQTDNWSRMTFTQEKPQRQSLKSVLCILCVSRAEKKETLRWFLGGTGSLTEPSFWQEGVGQVEDRLHHACYIWRFSGSLFCSAARCQKVQHQRHSVMTFGFSCSPNEHIGGSPTPDLFTKQ